MATETPNQKDMKTLDSFKKFIVVDEDNAAMSFDGDQFSYCTSSSWRDEQWPVEIYTKRKALELIAKTKKYRKECGFSTDGSYNLMPVKP